MYDTPSSLKYSSFVSLPFVYGECYWIVTLSCLNLLSITKLQQEVRDDGWNVTNHMSANNNASEKELLQIKIDQCTYIKQRCTITIT
jgi:hypothetical protein